MDDSSVPPNDDHHDDGADGDDGLFPDSNFLAQFRRPVTEAEMDEMVAALERAITEVFGAPDEGDAPCR